MKAIILGAGGQLGCELQATAHKRITVVPANRAALDVTDESSVAKYLHAERPDVVINAAAYTAVDKAESEPELAHKINALAPGYIAQAANVIGARLVHISTDFVFDGMASLPYRPDSATAPISVYGMTKREGEYAVMSHLPHTGFLILRTAWVYSAHGNNFVKTMLKLMRERKELRVVGDQIGTPTCTTSLARAIWCAIERELTGVHHWTDAGTASWYDFAVAIYEEARTLGILKDDVTIRQIATEDYPTPARRPAFSVLDKKSTWEALGQQPSHWRVHLRQMLQRVQQDHAT